MNVEGFDHVGILTEDLEAIIHVFGDVLGATLRGPEVERELGAEVLWVDVAGVALEFIRPIDPDSRAAQRIRAGELGLHHVALRVADLDESLADARRAQLQTLAPRQGAGGSRISFLDADCVAGTVVELVERPAQAS